ncbi:MAG: sulfite exporter TauE/SafE family protein [Saprospiraceae bacterium]|nr:sulfite exporter TauE/SafE family protein [Saprospiraceae bacterium]
MLEAFINSHPLTPLQWGLAILAAFLVGVAKSGLNSISIINVTVLAMVFGSKTSTGILLPMLILGDILAVIYYKRHVHWQSLLRLSPYLIAGILLGAWVGKDLNEVLFKKMMASIVLLMILTMLYWEYKPIGKVSQSVWFSGSMGIGTGFTSMVGNQASGFATTYLMSMNLSKLHFIGTNAWLFLFVNLFKLPFHIFSWHTINASSIGVNCALFPFQIIGFYAGVFIVKQINEARYRLLILWLTVFSAVFMFL